MVAVELEVPAIPLGTFTDRVYKIQPSALHSLSTSVVEPSVRMRGILLGFF